MFNDSNQIISSAPTVSSQGSSLDMPNRNSSRKKIIIGLIIVAFLILISVVFFIFKNKIFNNNVSESPVVAAPDNTSEENNSNQSGSLPVLGSAELPNDNGAPIDFKDIAVEYLSFADFYEAPIGRDKFVDFPDYTLPLNVKLDVLNYYDISRKINIDPVINNLNDQGFALIDNPWPKEATDFYSVYDKLDKGQIPVLITADFIIYHYQNIFKRAYKDIEGSVFYNNLWSINKELYLSAKNRYESRLAAVGNVNDSILEAARLQAAFFAVALELLKPSESQIAPESIGDSGKFFPSEASKFYFSPPMYLRDSVVAELDLIRGAKTKIKSPNLLYPLDYQKFSVPEEYSRSARLNNLYLTMKWLMAVFPLEYRNGACPDCLLDREDWRITTIAAAFIADDFSESIELKNRWARIYKIMSFFRPTREDLNYVFYRDTFRGLFGESADPSEIFDDRNSEQMANLEKFKAGLDKLEFSDFLGGISRNDASLRKQRGFKVLSMEYIPGDFVFNALTHPNVGVYLGDNPKPGINVTYCGLQGAVRRCNGSALDFINLVYNLDNYEPFLENSNYTSYLEKTALLSEKINRDLVWHTNNYWSTMAYLSKYLNANYKDLPLFSHSASWQNKNISTAAASWAHGQLPLEKFIFNQEKKSDNLNSLIVSTDYSYVEPNLSLIDELAAHSKMLKKMLLALQIDRENPAALKIIEELSSDLDELAKIVVKELSGEKLSEDDNRYLLSFAKKLKIENAEPDNRLLKLQFNNNRNVLKEDLSRLRLMVLVRAEDDGKVISVGPVWDYKESR